MSDDSKKLFESGLETLYKCDVAGAIMNWNKAFEIAELPIEDCDKIVSELTDFYFECIEGGLNGFSTEGLEELSKHMLKAKDIDLPMDIIRVISERSTSFRDSESLINYTLGVNRISYCSLINTDYCPDLQNKCEALMNTMSDICSISKVLNEPIEVKTILWKVADEYRTHYIELLGEWTVASGCMDESELIKRSKSMDDRREGSSFALTCAYYATEDLITCPPTDRPTVEDRRKMLISQFVNTYLDIV